MPCYQPLQAWQPIYANENGKKPLIWGNEPRDATPVEVACGQCIGCRLERSRQWAMRCTHEATLHETNSFITLTYDDKHLPPGGSLKKEDWQNFMKRLRKRIHPKKVRFFMCGEYGEEQDPLSPNLIGRPHYHAIIFNYDFPDRTYWRTENDNEIYRSELLEKAWPYGHCEIGSFTFESAAYVARYIVKKVNGEPAEEHYQRVDETTGQLTPLLPEFTLQSRNPGIARGWYDKYKSDLDKGFITMRGKKMPPPKFYEKIMDTDRPDELEAIKENRKISLRENEHDNTEERLIVKQKIREKRFKNLKRDL